ncbi:MAG TPA: hypothetical protein P5519_03125, partial [Spirochaetia bacterium]|nr:hypothetical protein [Spirochaetia bacterium]
MKCEQPASNSQYSPPVRLCTAFSRQDDTHTPTGRTMPLSGLCAGVAAQSVATFIQSISGGE